MSAIHIINLEKKFGTSTAVSGFSLHVNDGELVAFLGPSGCGKTTTLRMIAGFIEPTAGQILLDDVDITRLPVHKRNTGMVFQKYALFPHMTVAENVAFGLKMRKFPESEIPTRVKRALSMVQLEQYRDRYPRQLSGGQQQRVALARALVVEPKVFLLDEPLSNLDAKLRLEVREEIRTLQKNLGLTTIFVTHDQEEAMAISDRTAIMSNGKIQQAGSPRDLYEAPENFFVASFLGKMNFLEGKSAGGGFETSTGQHLPVKVHDKITRVGVRPENTRLALEQQSDAINLPGSIVSTAYLGSTLEIKCQVPGGLFFYCAMPSRSMFATGRPTPGQHVWVNFQAKDLNMFE